MSLVGGYETLTAYWSLIPRVQPYLCDFYAHKVSLQLVSCPTLSPHLKIAFAFSHKSRAFNVEIVAYQVPRLPIQTLSRIYVFPTETLVPMDFFWFVVDTMHLSDGYLIV